MKCCLITLVVVVLCQMHGAECGWGGSRANATRYTSNIGRNVYTKYTTNTAAQAGNGVTLDSKLDAVPRRGLGFSAWGIIGIIIGGILALMGIYYTTVFYPILCKKERRYDKMSAISNV